MKNNALKFLLILSLLLNASMLATAGYTHYQQSRHPELSSGVVRKSAEEPHAHLFEELALPPEKEALMRRKAEAFHADLEKKRQEIEQKRVYLLTLMRADEPDEKAIQNVIGDINKIQEGMQKEVVAHMLEFKSMLSKNQQKRFLDLIEAAMTSKQGLHCL
jgi:Spy/CpxP family protein refolding chaperone